ncbi:MAG: hypothetical protein D9C04_05860 [Nitrosopumilus sp. B06]|nr:MAG: hypothetical protein EB828_00715 [Nitrosopumilus sp. D6]RNJ79076.1 MAG: hypothetical protein D9C04_05860 [Nitrosopumilus sp. B06]
MVFVAIGLSILAILVVFYEGSCGIDHLMITGNIESYEQSLDPEMCEDLVEKIDLFNDGCKPQIETLDCG